MLIRRLGLWLVLMVAGLVSGCANSWTPFAGVTSGKNKAYASPVTAFNYNHEAIWGGSINGGCISNISGLNREEVGKRPLIDNSQCGVAYKPAKWKPGMTARIYWTVIPYPKWHPRVIRGGGVVVDSKEENLINSYEEYHQTTIPLPPPPPAYGDDFGKTSGITVHFLACNQIFITYGGLEEREQISQYMALFHKSQKLCRPRPMIQSMADYHKHKAEMDAIKEERKQIPQVILPEYIKQLEAEGRLPNQQPQTH